MTGSIYQHLAGHYDEIFPFGEGMLGFLECRLPTGCRRILDVGCGIGRFVGRLAEKGYQAEGVDLDAEMIAEARRRFPAAAFHAMDMGELSRLERIFQTAFCIGNVLPHLSGPQLEAFLDELGRCLEPGGIWIVQTMNWDRILASGSQEFPVRRAAGGDLELHRVYQEILPDRVRFVLTLRSAGRTLHRGAMWLHPRGSEAAEAVHARHGFRRSEHCGGVDGRPFDPTASPTSLQVYRKQ